MWSPTTGFGPQMLALKCSHSICESFRYRHKKHDQKLDVITVYFACMGQTQTSLLRFWKRCLPCSVCPFLSACPVCPVLCVMSYLSFPVCLYYLSCPISSVLSSPRTGRASQEPRFRWQRAPNIFNQKVRRARLTRVSFAVRAGRPPVWGPELTPVRSVDSPRRPHRH